MVNINFAFSYFVADIIIFGFNFFLFGHFEKGCILRLLREDPDLKDPETYAIWGFL